jgi:hypothetical protein
MNLDHNQNVSTEEEHGETKKIYLQVDNGDNNDDDIDLVNVFVNMAKRKKIYGYAFLLAICVGILAGCVKIFAGQIGKTDEHYAQAVITLQYQGIDEGLAPDGASLDINKLKSPTVIGNALDTIGETEFTVENIRSNISIEGVIPEDAVERITVIKETAATNTSNLEKILDVSYFPSQYVVYLNQIDGMTSDKTREILDAVIGSYRQYFYDTYADTEVLSVSANLYDIDSYDYAEAIDIIKPQLDIIQTYVGEKREQAPDFRASSTGLTFGDITTSLDSLEQVDIPNLSSYIENTSLTKDRDLLLQYYNYKIKQYKSELAEAESNLVTVQSTLDGYDKNQIVIISNQDTAQQVTQGSEYYDTLVQQKIDISKQISGINTKLDEAIGLLEALENVQSQNTQEQYDYANTKIEAITETLTNLIELTKETTEEYYNTTLMANAVKVATTAQYVTVSNSVSMKTILKTVGIFVAIMVFVVFMVWCFDGLRIEIILTRNKKYCKNRI